MLRLIPTSRDEMRARWARARRAEGGADEPDVGPRPLNLDVVLDLGNTMYFTFRGRAYGIPPLGWREGEALLDAWTEARAFGDHLERDDLPAYYDALERIQRLLWQNTRCVGRVRRVFRRMGLVRNPFRNATEGELGQLATFFLARRTTSNVRPVPAPRSRATSWTTSRRSRIASPRGRARTASR